ncbi:MAG: sulfite exporter TauE/SafE family protein [Desulfobacterales bacterium]|nr:sulfite exporter TauE/SafE family protein [Desulfobacterales bacterium]
MFEESVSYGAAFLAGLLSFLSPCVLPLIPAYFTFITGFSLDELTSEMTSSVRTKVIISTLAYVLGFSFVFIILGASASYVGAFINQYKDAIRIIGGIIIIGLGIHITGIIRITKLDFEKRINFDKKPVHIVGTFLIGMAFAAGWTPCIGPMLTSILIIASNQDSVLQGIILLSFYSAGMAIPFILISIFINYMLVFIKKAKKAMAYINASAGILLIIIGLLLVTDKLSTLFSF